MKKSTRLVSLMLTLVMVLGMLPQFTVSAAYENTHVNTGNQAYDIVEVAKTQIGYTEGSNNDTKYNRWLGSIPGYPCDGYGYAWCQSFVSWCAGQADIPTSEILRKPGTETVKQAFINNGTYHTGPYEGGSYTPKKGDIIYFYSSATDSEHHVGIVSDCVNGTVYTIEGNKSDMVKECSYPVTYSYIRGYGVPNYGGSVIEPLVTPTISTDKSSYNVGDTVYLSWAASPSNSNLSHYWLTIDAPDGSRVINETMNLNTSYSFTVTQAGNYSVTASATPQGSLMGEGSLTHNISIPVYNKELVFTASTTSVSLNYSQNEIRTVTFTYANYSGTVKLTAERSQDTKVSNLSWGEWSNQSVTLTIEGICDGTETVAVHMKDADTNEILSTIYITITVTSDPLVFTASTTSVNLDYGENATVTFTYANYSGTVYLIEEHDDNRVSNCTWGEWSNNSISLTFVGFTNGTETVTVHLKDAETDAILATTYITVNVTGYPLEFYASDNSCLMSNDNIDNVPGYTFPSTTTVSFEYRHYTGKVQIAFAHGENIITECSWESFENKVAVLNITLLEDVKNGTETITVYLQDATTYETLASKEVLITAFGNEIMTLDSKTLDNKTIIKLNGTNLLSDELIIKCLAPVSDVISIGANTFVDDNVDLSFSTGNSGQHLMGISQSTIVDLKGVKHGTQLITFNLCDGQTGEFLDSVTITVIVAMGDINQDGTTTVSDLVLLQKYLLAQKSFTETQFNLADLNSDGAVNAFDLALLKQILLTQ